MVIDRKFKITAKNPCSVKVYTEKEGVFFCAHDKALIPALRAYVRSCVALGSNPEHIESIELMIERVKEYQETIKSKVPDTETNCEIDRCIGGLGIDDAGIIIPPNGN